MNTAILPVLWVVLRKELRDIVRDRRTLALLLLVGPLLNLLFVLGMGLLAENRFKSEAEKRLEVPVIGAERAPNLIAHLRSLGIEAVEPPADLEAAIARQDVEVALEIGADFAEDWRAGRPAKVEIVSDDSRPNTKLLTTRLRTALTGYYEQVAMLRLMARGIDPAVVRPIAVASRDLATEEARRSRFLSFVLPYLLILLSFIGGSYLIIDATAGERERQSLEPLLATPAPRSTVVSGKIAAACTICLVSLLLTLFALKLSSQTSEAARSLDFGFPAIARMVLVLTPLMLIGNSLLTLLAATARNMKEAQTHMAWLIVLPVVPNFILMANPLKSQLWQYAIPFLAQNQLLQKIIRSDVIDGATWGVYLGSSLALSALLWFGAVRRYQHEKLAVSD
jgi:sodium transport system permease protein